MRQKGQLAVSWYQQQLENSANKIPFPKSFVDLNFQLKHPDRSICISLQKYVKDFAWIFCPCWTERQQSWNYI